MIFIDIYICFTSNLNSLQANFSHNTKEILNGDLAYLNSFPSCFSKNIRVAKRRLVKEIDWNADCFTLLAKKKVLWKLFISEQICFN